MQFLSRVSILTRDTDIAILTVRPFVRHAQPNADSALIFDIRRVGWHCWSLSTLKPLFTFMHLCGDTTYKTVSVLKFHVLQLQCPAIWSVNFRSVIFMSVIFRAPEGAYKLFLLTDRLTSKIVRWWGWSVMGKNGVNVNNTLIRMRQTALTTKTGRLIHI